MCIYTTNQYGLIEIYNQWSNAPNKKLFCQENMSVYAEMANAQQIRQQLLRIIKNKNISVDFANTFFASWETTKSNLIHGSHPNYTFWGGNGELESKNGSTLVPHSSSMWRSFKNTDLPTKETTIMFDKRIQRVMGDQIENVMLVPNLGVAVFGGTLSTKPVEPHWQYLHLCEFQIESGLSITANRETAVLIAIIRQKWSALICSSIKSFENLTLNSDQFDLRHLIVDIMREEDAISKYFDSPEIGRPYDDLFDGSHTVIQIVVNRENNLFDEDKIEMILQDIAGYRIIRYSKDQNI